MVKLNLPVYLYRQKMKFIKLLKWIKMTFMKGEKQMHYDKKLSENNRGFTLLELIVTVVILALVTAPFLSSFVSASRTNVKSKRIQEANELSQYIIEQFKASSITQLISEYGLTAEYDDPPANEELKQYTAELTGTNLTTLTTGFSEKYSAKITMKPSSSSVNGDVTPIIDKLDKDTCAVFAQNIYSYDSTYAGSGADKRDINVDISYVPANAPKPYTVTLTVTYRTAMGGVIAQKTMSSLTFEKIPVIYIIYTPFYKKNGVGILSSTTDKIVIDNNLATSAYEVDSNGKISNRLETYIIQQESLGGSVSPTNVQINENGFFPANCTAVDQLELGLTSLLGTTIYTNIGTGSTQDVNGIVKLDEINSLYDLEVEISYAGEHISTFDATKITVN